MDFTIQMQIAVMIVNLVAIQAVQFHPIIIKPLLLMVLHHLPADVQEMNIMKMMITQHILVQDFIGTMNMDTTNFLIMEIMKMMSIEHILAQDFIGTMNLDTIDFLIIVTGDPGTIRGTLFITGTQILYGKKLTENFSIQLTCYLLFAIRGVHCLL
jgi:hypothetical protein